jgi:hypothetical protein
MASYPPQLPSESPQAYQAACAYFGMGVDRSVTAVAQELHKSRPLMGRWSSQHDWVNRAAEYDAAVQEDIAQERTKRYLADLEDHRTRYQMAGRLLYQVAGKMLKRMDKEVDTLELTPAALGILLRGLTTAGDLEAHALNLDAIMPSLTGDSDD